LKSWCLWEKSLINDLKQIGLFLWKWKKDDDKRIYEVETKKSASKKQELNAKSKRANGQRDIKEEKLIKVEKDYQESRKKESLKK